MNLLTRIRRLFLTWFLVKFIIRKSKQIRLLGFQGIPLFDVSRFFLEQVKKVGLNERASAISFNFILAIPPAIIFLFTLIPHLPISQQFIDQLYRLIQDFVPGEKNNSVLIRFLNDFIKHPRNGLLSFGFLLSLYYSSNAMMGIMRSFDLDSVIFKKRSGWQQRRTAIGLTLILNVLILVSIFLMVAQDAFLCWIGITNEFLIDLISNSRWIIIVLLFFFSISFIYRHAPSVHKKWRIINPGSILASALMILSTLAFSFWVTRFGSYNRLYGSIGTILIVMLIIYINSLVLLIGFELNVSITSLKHIVDERNKSAAGGAHNR